MIEMQPSTRQPITFGRSPFWASREGRRPVHPGYVSRTTLSNSPGQANTFIWAIHAALGISEGAFKYLWMNPMRGRMRAPIHWEPMRR